MACNSLLDICVIGLGAWVSAGLGGPIESSRGLLAISSAILSPSSSTGSRKASRCYAAERGKRDIDCDKQIEKAVTAPNCVLKGSWGEGGSGGIRKKLKSEYAAYLESNFRRNDGSSI